MAPFGLETVLMALDEEVAANAENQLLRNLVSAGSGSRVS
jgi:hypothetical protein